MKLALRVVLVFLTLALPLVAHAEDRHDWNGRWIFYRVDKAGKVYFDKIGGAIDIVDGKVRNGWSGCIIVPRSSFSVSRSKVRVQFTPGGTDYTIVLVRTLKDRAKVIFRDKADGYIRGDEESDEFAFRIPLNENCAAAPF